MYSLVIPIYKNSASIPELLTELSKLNNKLENKLECIFVVDGSPENEFNILQKLLSKYNFKSQLIAHSKNFGSFSAIRTGFEQGSGKYFCFMAADLQESISLIEKIFVKLKNNDLDIVIAKRTVRQDALIDTLFSNIYWKFYRFFINRDIPAGGVDLFGCSQQLKDILLSLKEQHTSLVGLLYWTGFKKEYIEYQRQKRKFGKSTWSFPKKFNYAIDSIYSFSKLPINLINICGILGIISSFLFLNEFHFIYFLVIFFGSLNILVLGILAQYLWRIYENSKKRPQSLISKKIKYN